MNTQAPVTTHRPAAERGATHLGWLDSKHSFSFGGYHHADRMGYHGLRVINDDRVAPAMGFDTHPHRDMEILTWVLDGELAHKDSMGHASALGAGGIQLMSAGTGVAHSEFNGQDDAPVHFLQVWISPRQRGSAPRYQEAVPDPATRAGRFAALATPDGRDGSLVIGADAEVYVGDFATGQTATLALAADQVAYVHVATGGVTVQGQSATAGDAVTVEGQDQFTVDGAEAGGQVLVFVLPA
ncbi:MAG: pirin family protein [Planctomycetota bacterium]